MIKGPKSFGNLNPIFVMGKTAFIYFLKEWINEINKTDLNYGVVIANEKIFKKGNDYSRIEINGVRIINIIGFSISLIKTDPVLTINKYLWQNFSILKENWTFSNNIIIDYIINPNSSKLKEKNINPDIILQTKQMILERSAELKKDFFKSDKYYL